MNMNGCIYSFHNMAQDSHKYITTIAPNLQPIKSEMIEGIYRNKQAVVNKYFSI